VAASAGFCAETAGVADPGRHAGMVEVKAMAKPVWQQEAAADSEHDESQPSLFVLA